MPLIVDDEEMIVRLSRTNHETTNVFASEASVDRSLGRAEERGAIHHSMARELEIDMAYV
jgi:hypothetical protein